MVEEGRLEEVDVSKQLARQQAEEKRLAEMMIPKKHRRLYHKIAYKKKKISQEVGHVVLARVLVFVYASGRGGRKLVTVVMVTVMRQTMVRVTVGRETMGRVTVVTETMVRVTEVRVTLVTEW